MSDSDIRLAAFDWLAEQVGLYGEVLPWRLLTWGFEHQGRRIGLVSQQGIFKPAVMELPISIRTSAAAHYDDTYGPEGLHYRYRGTNPQAWDNRALRKAYQQGVPLVYFYGLAKGQYLAVWPVYIVGDDPEQLTFTVEVDDAVAARELLLGTRADEIADTASRREYVTALVRRRLHQRSFREKVLRAYRQQCALCRLRHRELLDAAHIVEDQDEGPPVIPNGIALCKLHHAAFDSLFVAVRPDFRVVVRSDILEESDGPMLVHGLQGFDGQRILLPRKEAWRPDPERLAQRWERFTNQVGR